MQHLGLAVYVAFAKIERTVGLCGEEILLLDDSEKNAEAALSMGWQAVHWTEHCVPAMVRRLCT